jgi:hypothetical protein
MLWRSEHITSNWFSSLESEVFQWIIRHLEPSGTFDFAWKTSLLHAASEAKAWHFLVNG